VPKPSAVLALLLLASCSAQSPPADARTDKDTVRRIAVPDLILPRETNGGAVLDGAWTLRSRLPIDGLSAMALMGERLLLATDGGQLFETICPAEQDLGQCGEHWQADGRLIARGAPRADLEAMAARPDGSIVLGLENAPRLALLEQDGEGNYRIGKLPGAPNLRQFQRNSGPEAVAALPDGRLLVLPEGGVDADGVALVALEEADGRWGQRTLPLPETGLLPTEAAIAGHHLFVLLRGFSLLGGWRGTIVVLPLAALDAEENELRAPTIIAEIADQGIADNYEAMAVRLLPDGSYSLLVASDDNGFALQQKLLLLLSWKPAAD
jgi:hypothetical protein